MSSVKLQHVLMATISISYLLVLSLPSTTGAEHVSTGKGERNDDSDNEKQWDMSFPYYLMMMSNGKTVSPSIWLIPVVIASCAMLYIRGSMDWM